MQPIVQCKYSMCSCGKCVSTEELNVKEVKGLYKEKDFVYTAL